MTIFNWRKAFWLLLSTVLVPAALSLSVGILILVFYQEKWDVASGVLVLCFAIFAVVGSSITVTVLRRSARLAQLQTEFIANMSHDFRTPLTAIRMFVETLRQGRLADPEERSRCLDLLAEETGRMEQLVNQVLTWRSVENTGGNYKLEPHNAEQVVRTALEPLELDQRTSRRLELVVEPHLPRILADEEALSRAVRNLVENALKYGQGRSVVVNLRTDGQGVAISVRDQGPAIPRREHKRIFKRFYRMPGTGKQGTGLGLAIARHTAEAHGGSLDLRSARGVGNVFTLRLPLVITGEAPPKKGQADARANEA
jgi:two-component system phosphate regulon sensor histidine kinase PhoR